MGRQDYQRQHEPCLYGWKPGAKHYFVSDFSLSTVLESSLEGESKAELIALIKSYQEVQPTSILRVNRPQANQDHPTMKPLALIERLVRHSSRQEDVVLDTFVGSGTTLMVCEQLNRVNYSMELDPKYVQGILKRFERETGIKSKQLYQADLKRVFEVLLRSEVNNEQMRELLIDLGYEPINEMALALVVLQKALTGDVKVFSKIQALIDRK